MKTNKIDHVSATPLCITALLLLILNIISLSVYCQQTPTGNKFREQNEHSLLPYLPPPAVRQTSIPVRIDEPGFTMIQVNTDSAGLNMLGDAANEPSLAVNPENPMHMVIGWRQFDDTTSDFRQAGYAYSADAGESWTFPGVIEPGIFRSDPVLDYDAEGNFYYSSLTVNGFVAYQKIFKSTDGGMTWDAGTNAHGGDKQWISVDHVTELSQGNIYSAWSQNYKSCNGTFTRSLDNGQSFSPCTTIPYDFWPGMTAIGNNGEVFSGGEGYLSTVMVVKSNNAQFPDSTVSWEAYPAIQSDGWIPPPLPVNPGGLPGQVNIAVDHSAGTGYDFVYLLTCLKEFPEGDSSDLYFARSTDGGVTWDNRVRINDDTGVRAIQWFGTMSVAPNGRIDVVWLDTRDAPPGEPLSALYYSFSLDQGESWSVNTRLSPLFNSRIGCPVYSDKMGDYFTMTSGDECAYLAWANTFNGEQDVYFSKITPIPTGIPDRQSGIRLSAFPNPFTDNISITYDLPESGETSVYLTDISGRTIKNLTSGHREKGSHSLKSCTAGLSGGFYLLNVVCGQKKSVMKLAIRP